MKILTPEEEREHNKVIWEGGTIGAVGGLAIGSLAVFGASRQFPAFRQLSAPFRVFLVTGSTAFSGVINADRYSRSFEASRHEDAGYVNKSESTVAQAQAQKSSTDQFKTWVSEQRYPIVFGSWVVSMAVALGLVGRNPYMTGQQKLVQARVYAQGLTLAVLVASFALEGNDLRAGKGRWETIKVVDPDDPQGKRMVEKRIHHEAYEGEDQWMDMLDAQEQKMKKAGHAVRDGDKSKAKKENSSEGNGKEEKSAEGNGEAKKGGEQKQEGEQKKEPEAKAS